MNQQHHSNVYWALHDNLIFIRRSLKHILKNRDQMLGLTIQPIMFMLLFFYVFGGAIQTGTSYINFLVAGILVQMLAFGSMTTSFSVAIDIQRGIIERFKSMPIVSWGVVMGHVVADIGRNVIQSLIMFAVAFLVGFRPEASFGDWLLITAILILFSFAISWVSAIMGLIAKTVEAVQWLSFLAIFPLTFASAAFVPTDTMPTWLRIFAENQPVTRVIEAVRALMLGTPVEGHAVAAVVWCIAITIVSIPIAARLFRQYTGR
jgi:ABC-2 type transport system permease protein